MAKIVKKKRRKLKLQGFAILFFSFSFIAWLGTTLFVNTINASLTMKIQKLNDELTALTEENQTLNFEIQSLENKDRIYQVAQTANMDQIQDNIISIVGE